MNESEKWNIQISHPLQSWEWGEFRKQRQPIDRINGMLIIWTRVPHSPWVFGYMPMGKVPNEKDFAELKKLGKSRNAIGIRLEPEKASKTDWVRLKTLKKTRGLFKSKTVKLNLELSEKELLDNMHPKTRYNIRLAQKHGVEVCEDSSDSAFDKYLSLMFTGTAKRQKIFMHTRNYHIQMWKVLKKSGVASLWLARYQGTVLAANVIFKFKNKIFYAYGATALEHREVMAPSLLLWKIALWGKDTGIKIFDLWGVETGKGFSRFKEQFGGGVVYLPGSFDLVILPWLYPIFRIVEEVRWFVIHRLK